MHYTIRWNQPAPSPNDRIIEVGGAAGSGRALCFTGAVPGVSTHFPGEIKPDHHDGAPFDDRSSLRPALR